MKCITKWLVISVVLLTIVATWVFFSARFDASSSHALSIPDYGFTLAYKNSLMKEMNASFGDSQFILSRVYYDGQRLYAIIFSDDGATKCEDLSCDLITNSATVGADHKYAFNEGTIFIWDKVYCLEGHVIFKLGQIDGAYVQTPDIFIESPIPEFDRVQKYYEELYIESIISAETSTYIDLRLIVAANMKNPVFQIEKDDIIVSTVQFSRTENEYQLLFPGKFDIDSGFILHISFENGTHISIPVQRRFA